jgi:hypothetical protein
MSGTTANHGGDSALVIAQRAVQLARAARLDEFGQLPDWVTPDAHDAILLHAEGGRNRLHLLLATALLLAEKENRDNIDLALVQRAASLQSQVEPVHVAAVPAAGVRHHPVWLLAVSFSIACAILAVSLGIRLAVNTHVAAPTVRTHPVPPAQKPPGPVAALAVRQLPVPAPVPVLAPAPVPRAAATPPSTQPPIQQAGQTAAPWQPSEPSPIVVVRASAAAQPRVQQLQALLASKGWQVATEPNRRSKRGVWAHYFYVEDRDAANRVVAAALPPGVIPSLVLTRHGHAAPPPGTIEVHID